MVVAVDGPIYESVEEVIANSDLYVRGTVGSVIGTELDGGGARPETEENSVRITWVNLRVLDSSDQKIAENGTTVPFLWEDYAQSDGEQTGRLFEGEEIILLAKDKTKTVAPGMDLVPAGLAPIGGPAGILDVTADSVSPHDPRILAFAAYGADAPTSSTERASMPTQKFVEFAAKGLNR